MQYFCICAQTFAAIKSAPGWVGWIPKPSNQYMLGSFGSLCPKYSGRVSMNVQSIPGFGLPWQVMSTAPWAGVAAPQQSCAAFGYA